MFNFQILTHIVSLRPRKAKDFVPRIFAALVLISFSGIWLKSTFTFIVYKSGILDPKSLVNATLKCCVAS